MSGKDIKINKHSNYHKFPYSKYCQLEYPRKTESKRQRAWKAFFHLQADSDYPELFFTTLNYSGSVWFLFCLFF